MYNTYSWTSNTNSDTLKVAHFSQSHLSSCIILCHTISALRDMNSMLGSVFGLLSYVMQHHRFDPPPKFGLLSYVMQHHRFDPPPNHLFGGVYPWEFWLSTPYNSFRWEHKMRSSLHTHVFHCMDPKDAYFHDCQQLKHTQHAPSTDCD